MPRNIAPQLSFHCWLVFAPVVIGVISGPAAAQGWDPVQSLFQSESTFGSAAMSNGQAYMNQGAPTQPYGGYQLPPPQPAPAPVLAPQPYVYHAPVYSNPQGTARLNSNLYNSQANALLQQQQRVQVPTYRYQPAPSYQRYPTFTYRR